MTPSATGSPGAPGSSSDPVSPCVTAWRRRSGCGAAVEVDTDHELVGRARLTFTQVFVGEVDADGSLRRVQAYTPYPPPALP